MFRLCVAKRGLQYRKEIFAIVIIRLPVAVVCHVYFQVVAEVAQILSQLRPGEPDFRRKLFRCSRALPVNQVMDKTKFIKRYTSHNGSFSLFLKCNVNCVLKVKIGLFIPVLPFNCCKSRNRIDNIQKTDIDNRKI